MFVLEKMDEIKGRIPFYKLKKHNYNQLDDFETEIDNHTGYLKEYRKILSWMDMYSNGELVGKAKFRRLDSAKEPYSLFEFKSKNLRVYGMGCPLGELIILAGYKNRQNRDIKRVREIAKEVYQGKIKT
jgi:hypothetical protein